MADTPRPPIHRRLIWISLAALLASSTARAGADDPPQTPPDRGPEGSAEGAGPLRRAIAEAPGRRETARGDRGGRGDAGDRARGAWRGERGRDRLAGTVGRPSRSPRRLAGGDGGPRRPTAATGGRRLWPISGSGPTTWRSRPSSGWSPSCPKNAHINKCSPSCRGSPADSPRPRPASDRPVDGDPWIRSPRFATCIVAMTGIFWQQ
jgi:hypothetical protein